MGNEFSAPDVVDALADGLADYEDIPSTQESQGLAGKPKHVHFYEPEAGPNIEVFANTQEPTASKAHVSGKRWHAAAADVRVLLAASGQASGKGAVSSTQNPQTNTSGAASARRASFRIDDLLQNDSDSNTSCSQGGEGGTDAAEEGDEDEGNRRHSFPKDWALDDNVGTRGVDDPQWGDLPTAAKREKKMKINKNKVTRGSLASSWERHSRLSRLSIDSSSTAGTTPTGDRLWDRRRTNDSMVLHRNNHSRKQSNAALGISQGPNYSSQEVCKKESSDKNSDQQLLNFSKVKRRKLGILRLDYQYPVHRGDVNSPQTWQKFEVKYRAIPGLTRERAWDTEPLPDHIWRFGAKAMEYLVDNEGVNVLTSDCGMFLRYLETARAFTDIPVILSSLQLLPALQCALAPGEKFCVLTSFGKERFANVNRHVLKRFANVDLENCDTLVTADLSTLPSFVAMHHGQLNVKKLARDVVKLALKVMRAHREADRSAIRAFLIGPHELGAVSDVLRYATGLPVFDVITMADFVMEGFGESERFGIRGWQEAFEGLNEQDDSSNKSPTNTRGHSTGYSTTHLQQRISSNFLSNKGQCAGPGPASAGRRRRSSDHSADALNMERAGDIAFDFPRDAGEEPDEAALHRAQTQRFADRLGSLLDVDRDDNSLSDSVSESNTEEAEKPSPAVEEPPIVVDRETGEVRFVRDAGVALPPGYDTEIADVIEERILQRFGTHPGGGLSRSGTAQETAKVVSSSSGSSPSSWSKKELVKKGGGRKDSLSSGKGTASSGSRRVSKTTLLPTHSQAGEDDAPDRWWERDPNLLPVEFDPELGRTNLVIGVVAAPEEKSPSEIVLEDKYQTVHSKTSLDRFEESDSASETEETELRCLDHWLMQAAKEAVEGDPDGELEVSQLQFSNPKQGGVPVENAVTGWQQTLGEETFEQYFPDAVTTIAAAVAEEAQADNTIAAGGTTGSHVGEGRLSRNNTRRLLSLSDHNDNANQKDSDKPVELPAAVWAVLAAAEEDSAVPLVDRPLCDWALPQQGPNRLSSTHHQNWDSKKSVVRDHSVSSERRNDSKFFTRDSFSESPRTGPATLRGSRAASREWSQSRYQSTVLEDNSELMSEQESESALAAKAPRDNVRLGVIRLDYYYPAAPGDIDSADSFPYDVFYTAIPGLTFEMCQDNTLTPEVTQNFIDGIKYLTEVKKVHGITGDCGFMMWLQELAREHTDVPVFMSSLAALPLLESAFGKNELIAIVTANERTLEPMYGLIAKHCNVDPRKARFKIIGCQDVPGFEAVANGIVTISPKCYDIELCSAMYAVVSIQYVYAVSVCVLTQYVYAVCGRQSASVASPSRD